MNKNKIKELIEECINNGLRFDLLYLGEGYYVDLCRKKLDLDDDLDDLDYYDKYLTVGKYENYFCLRNEFNDRDKLTKDVNYIISIGDNYFDSNIKDLKVVYYINLLKEISDKLVLFKKKLIKDLEKGNLDKYDVRNKGEYYLNIMSETGDFSLDIQIKDEDLIVDMVGKYNYEDLNEFLK